MVFEAVHESRAFVRFAQERLPHYKPLIADDMRRLRKEMIKASAGAAMATGAGLMFAAFASLAAIVSAAPHRAITAWIVCGAWGLIALAGLLVARRAVSGPPPFHLVGTALARDYARFLNSLS